MKTSYFKYELLKRNMLYLIILLIGTVSISSIINYMSSRNLIFDANDQLLTALNQQAEHFLYHPAAELALIGNALKESASENAKQERIELIVAQFAYLDRVEVLNNQGIVQTTYPLFTDRIGLDLSGTKEFQNSNQSGPLYGDTFIDPLTQEPTMAVYLGVTNDITIIGYLNLSHLQTAFNDLTPVQGDLSIIDDKGVYILHKNTDYIHQRVVDPLAAAIRASNLKNGSVVTIDNAAYFLQYQRIENTQWYLLIYRSIKELYQPIFITVLAISLTMVVIFLLIGTQLTRMLHRFNTVLYAFIEMAKQVAQGKYQHLKTDFAYVEFAELSKAFSHMVDEIESREEEINAYIDELEVNQRLLDQQLQIEQRISEFTTILLSLEFENAQSQYLKALDKLVTAFDVLGVELHLALNPQDQPKDWKNYSAWKSPAEDNAKMHDLILDCIQSDASKLENTDQCISHKDFNLIIRPMKANQITIGCLVLVVPPDQYKLSNISSHFFGIVTNIFYETHKKYLFEMALMDSREAAKASSIAKSQFLANMSHEIRTPMNGIFGYLEILNTLSLDTTTRGYIQEIESVSKGLLRIINDILDISKIESGQFSLVQEPYNLGQTLKEAVSIHSFEAYKRNITLTYDIDPLFPTNILGDAARVKQVLYNLIHNAIKFTSQGSVTISLALETNFQQKPNAKIRVKDTGIGIPPEFLKDLFTPFTQADTSNTRNYGGTGLGLAITKQLLDAMDGSISVDSEVGSGTTFTLHIPVQLLEISRQATQSESETTPIEAPNEATLEPTRNDHPILIVDDNLVNQMVVRKVLESKGITCEVAGDGLEAYEKVKTGKYRTVFMDCQMPIMDGYESTRRIRQLPVGHTIRIIAMTANAMVGDEEKCLEAGMDAYISKPLDYKKMIALILEE